METVLLDMRFAFRTLVRRPLFTVVAIATLGLGIGASTTVFSVVDGTLLWDPPYEDPDRLVVVSGAYKLSRPGDVASSNRWGVGAISFPEYQRWRENQTLFEGVAAYAAGSRVLTGVGRPERLLTGIGSTSLLSVLGVRPPLGRWFLPGEDGPGARQVAVLGHAFWEERFASDPQVLGKTLLLDDEPYEVVGVLPEGFRLRSLGSSASGSDSGNRDLWIPLGAERTRFGERDRAYEGVGRLAAGVTLEQARAETVALLRGDQDPERRSAFLVPRKVLETRGFRSPLLIILGASGLLLLIACGNVAALILAEFEGRREEMAVRKAVGAGTGRLFRHLLAEALILGSGGALVGLVLGLAGTRGLLRLAPPLPHLDEVGVSGTVLLFGALLGVVTAVLCALAPLKEICAPVGRTPRRGVVEATVLPVQLALTLVLLVAGGLLTRSLSTLLSVDTGFEAERVAMIQSVIPGEEGTDFGELQARLGALPGVEAVGGISRLPFHEPPDDPYFEVVGRESASEEDRPLADRGEVLPGYFEAMGIPLLEGRTVEPTDRAGAPLVAVVSEALAREHWPGTSAVGRQIRIQDLTYTVVGVVGDVRHRSFASEVKATFYLPLAQSPTTSPTLVVRTSGDPAAILPSLRAAVWEVHPDALIREAESMSALQARATGGERFRTALLGAFGLCALLLAAAGVSGVTARKVARRTKELGIRKALGAGEGALVTMVVRETLGLGAVGIGVGLLGAFGVSRILSAYLFGIEPWDLPTYAGALGVLVAVSLAAAFLPARNATRVEPVQALRSE